MPELDLPDWYSQLVLPVVIGFLTAAIGSLFSYVNDVFDRKKKLRHRELERALKIHDDIVKSLDRLMNHLKWDAWYIAMRKAKSRGETDGNRTEPSNDSERWQLYKDALDEWRSFDLLFTSQVRAYFPDRKVDGKMVSPSRMICEITKLVNDAAWDVWKLYWEENFCTGSSFMPSRLPTQEQYEDSHVTIDFETESDRGENHFENEDYDLKFSTIKSVRNKAPFLSARSTLTASYSDVEHLMGLTQHEKRGKSSFNKKLDKIDEVFVHLSSVMTRDIQEEKVGKLRKDCYKPGSVDFNKDVKEV